MMLFKSAVTRRPTKYSMALRFLGICKMSFTKWAQGTELVRYRLELSPVRPTILTAIDTPPALTCTQANPPHTAHQLVSHKINSHDSPPLQKNAFELCGQVLCRRPTWNISWGGGTF